MKLKQNLEDKSLVVIISLLSGLTVYAVWFFMIPPIAEYTFSEFILNDQELVEKADSGYSEVCKYYFGVGTSCIIKKEWVSFELSGSAFNFEIIGGNGCQYFVYESGEIFDGLKENDGDCSSRIGFGSYQPTWHVYNIGDY